MQNKTEYEMGQIVITTQMATCAAIKSPVFPYNNILVLFSLGEGV
jgi:hypothetical protein